MDRVITNVIADRPATYGTPANPVDLGWNIAVQTLAKKCLPNGYDVVERFEDAPTTLQAVSEYAKAKGRLCVAAEDSDGTIFDCPETNIALRAWHDSVHYRFHLAFTVAGEAAAVYVQAAQVYRVYGVSPKTIRWVQLLLADILGLVIHHKRTGKYPTNKRAGCVNEAKKWKHCAELIADQCRGAGHEQAALRLARENWGLYSE